MKLKKTFVNFNFFVSFFYKKLPRVEKIEYFVNSVNTIKYFIGLTQLSVNDFLI